MATMKEVLGDELAEVHVWCFIVDGDDEPLHYIVPRNEVAIAELRERCEAFEGRLS
jgi:hypothetical protein